MNEDKISTPVDVGDEIIDTKEYYLLESFENKKYSIRINKTKLNILIEANQIHASNTSYQIELNFNDFQQISKGFKMCDTLDEIYDVIQTIFTSNKVTIIKKNNCLIIILKIILIGGKEHEINIELNKISNIEINDKNSIKLNDIENEIKEIKSVNNKLLYKIKYLEDIKKWNWRIKKMEK